MKLKKEKIIIAVLAVVLLIVIAVLAVFLLKQKEEPAVSASSVSNQYDANVIVDDPATLQDMVDEIMEKAKEGQMALNMQVEARSEDGENFSCYLANSEANSYDMYLIISLDETQEELCRTGLIPLGGRIESFTSSVKLEPGTHTGTVTFVQVEEDMETIHAQVNIGLELKVIY